MAIDTKVRNQIETAKQLIDAAQFDQATTEINQGLQAADARLTDAVEELRDLLTTCQEQQQQAIALSEELTRQAITAFERKEFQKALDCLRKIPEPLIFDKQQELLQQTEAAVQEITTLRGLIKKDLAQNEYDAALPRLERLIELRPKDATLVKLHSQIQSRANKANSRDAILRLKRAKQLLKDFKYDLACETLLGIPDSAKTEEICKVERFANELKFLHDAIRAAPVVDTWLVELVKRFAKLSPDDPAASKLQQEVRQRRETQQSPLRNPRWSKSGGTPAITHETNLLSDFGLIDVQQQLDQKLFQRYARELPTACGLALAGLGKATVDCNLAIKKQSSRLGRLGSMLKSRSKVNTAWGIDIGTSALKAVKLRSDGEAVVMEEYEYIKHASPPSLLKDEEAQREIFLETLKLFRTRHEFDDEPLVVSLDASRVLGRFFSIPQVEPRRLTELMKIEVKQQIPFPIDSIRWDYHVWPSSKDASLPLDGAMLVSATYSYVDQKESLFKEVDLNVQALVPEPVALYNFAQFALNNDTTLGLVELGDSGMNLVVCDPNFCWFRHMVGGVDTFTQALARGQQRSFTAAEEMTFRLDQFESLYDLHDIWKPCYQKIQKNLATSVTAFESHSDTSQLTRLIALGSGTHLPGILPRLIT